LSKTKVVQGVPERNENDGPETVNDRTALSGAKSGSAPETLAIPLRFV